MPKADARPRLTPALLAAPLIDAASRAGAAILGYHGKAIAVGEKDDRSPVTAADHASEAILLASLRQAAPEIPIVSEEAVSQGLGPAEIGDRFFLVDPLDGTKEFLAGREDFTVNVALIEQGRPVFGLVYAPAKCLAFVTLSADTAVEVELPPSAAGAALSDCALTPIAARAANDRGLVAVASRSHLDPETERFLGSLSLAGRVQAGSALKFGLLAKGEADVYPRLAPTMEWDTAAGHAVLAAAGGTVEDTTGRPMTYGHIEREFRNPGFIAWGRRPT